MKKKLKLIPFLVLLSICCPVWGQTGKNIVTYTIDGGTFHHKLVTFSANPKSASSGVDASAGYLKLYIDDAPSEDADSKFAFVLIFNKLGTGTAKVFDPVSNATGDDKGAVVCFTLGLPQNKGSLFLTRSLNFPAHTPGTITITRFGPVGGTIEGTFEATLIDLGRVKYTITGGHFVITRKA